MHLKWWNTGWLKFNMLFQRAINGMGEKLNERNKEHWISVVNLLIKVWILKNEYWNKTRLFSAIMLTWNVKRQCWILYLEESSAFAYMPPARVTMLQIFDPQIKNECGSPSSQSCQAHSKMISQPLHIHDGNSFSSWRSVHFPSLGKFFLPAWAQKS